MLYAHSEPPHRQRSARNDPAMRDGDSGHGNPGEPAGDLFAVDSDTDVGDTEELDRGIDEEPELSGATPEAMREFRELQEEVAANDRYSDDAAVDATILSQEREAIGDKKEDEGDVAQPTTAAGAEAALPLADYGSLTVKDILDRVREMSPTDVSAILEFERANRDRKTLVTGLERQLEGRTRPRRQHA
jgi:hypothetical protein